MDGPHKDRNTRLCVCVCVCVSRLTSYAFTHQSSGTRRYYCCFILRSRQIPMKYIASYAIADRCCPKLSASKEVCVDPSEKWLQDIMNLLDIEPY
uniref:Chemokine interleukin-8-like domain-containing protein n=1 Tax=Salarias fasciatus TaxID=181472 RepID=A0A672GW57_SALFA